MAISVVQIANAARIDTSPATVNFSSTPSVGNMVLVAVALNNNFSPGNASVSDNQGNTFSLVQRVNNDSNHGSLELWKCGSLTTASGTYTVTVSWSTTQAAKIAILEASGTSGAADQIGTNFGSSVAALTATASGANTSANELVVGLVNICTNNPGAALSHPPSSSYTEWAFDDGSSDFKGTPSDFGYKIVSATETSSAGWTWTNNATANAIVATFKAAGLAPKVVEDDLTITDVVLRVIKRLKEEDLTITDPAAHRSWVQITDETLTLSDLDFKTAIKLREDDLTIFDARAGTRVALREEDLTLTDLRAKTAKLLREDDLTLIDGFIKTVVPSGNVRLKVLEEDLVITDLRGVTLVKVREDDLILIDPGAHRFWIQTVDQPLTLVDEFIKTVVQGGGVRTIITSDALVIVDDAGQRYWMHRGLTTDNLVLTDAAVELLQRIRALSDQIIVSDGTVQIRLSRQVIADLIGTTDQVLAQYLPMVTYEVHIRIGAEPSPNVLGGYH